MTKYYVGYLQGDNSYVYVSSIDNGNVRIATIPESAIAFDDVELAKNLLELAKAIVVNQEYVVLAITTEVKEVK